LPGSAFSVGARVAIRFASPLSVGVGAAAKGSTLVFAAGDSSASPGIVKSSEPTAATSAFFMECTSLPALSDGTTIGAIPCGDGASRDSDRPQAFPALGG
jgi:hypothetical protein